jgi:hypothetical protein
MHDFITTSALALYPIVAIFLFASRRFSRAVIWTVLLAQLLLPVGPFIKFDKIPQFDKFSIPCLCLLIGCAMAGRVKFLVSKKFGLVEFLTALFLFGPFMTSFFNGEALRYGPLQLAGVGLYDAFSNLGSAFITLIPYFVGRTLMREEVDNAEILRALILSMLAYSIPTLFEVRLSPQLHYWVYGSYASMFAQSFRDGGFRPSVFMGHGLVLAHYMAIAVIAAVGLWRLRLSILSLWPRVVSNYRIVAWYLAVILLFCRTLGADLYAIFFSFLVLFTSAKTQMKVAVMLVFLALLYPTMRYVDIAPTNTLVKIANSISEERGGSLDYRFNNENLLLKHAIQKPVFGWGRFGRNRVYDEDGKDLAVTDGEWIIVLGQWGAVGFIAEFGLLSLVLFKAAAALRYAKTRRESMLFSVLALIVASSIFDLLPNAFLFPWTWLMAGTLLGRAEALLARKTVVSENDLSEKAVDHLAPGLAIKGRLQAMSNRTS